MFEQQTGYRLGVGRSTALTQCHLHTLTDGPPVPWPPTLLKELRSLRASLRARCEIGKL